MVDKKTFTRCLIGGPARCGKSVFAQLISDQADGPAVLRVDALLHRYLGEKTPGNAKQMSRFIQAYLTRPRYMNPQRSETRCPIEDFDLPLDNVVESAAPREGMSCVQVIAAALDVLAGTKRKTEWVALDLHPEFWFRIYQRQIPYLKLIILLRDPVEAIAASLYWRTYPDRVPNDARNFRYFLTLWHLSVSAGMALRDAFPDQVCLVSSNDLFAGRARLPDWLDQRIGKLDFEALFDGDPFFSARQSGSGIIHYCPDGSWKPLLSEKELLSVGRLRDHYWNKSLFEPPFRPGSGSPATGFQAMAATLAKSRPGFAKSLVDGIYFPDRLIRRKAERLKAVLRTELSD